VAKSMMKTASPAELGELAKLRHPNASWDAGVAKNDPASMKALQMALSAAGFPSKTNAEALQQLEKFKKSNTQLGHGPVGNNWAHELNQRLLTTGSQGEGVKQLRDDLAKLGYPVKPGDTVDQTTFKAIEDFQAAHHLKVDGKVGPNTRLKMAQELLKPTPSKPPAAATAAAQPKEIRIRPKDTLAQGVSPGDKVTLEIPEGLWDSGHFDGLKLTARGPNGTTVDLPPPNVQTARDKYGKVTATFTVDKAWQKADAQDIGINIMEDKASGGRAYQTVHVGLPGSGTT